VRDRHGTVAIALKISGLLRFSGLLHYTQLTHVSLVGGSLVFSIRDQVIGQTAGWIRKRIMTFFVKWMTGGLHTFFWLVTNRSRSLRAQRPDKSPHAIATGHDEPMVKRKREP
jgi:hypothetical protein